MKIFSAFNGISGARLACERVGLEIEKYYSSEVDKFCLEIDQKNYPDNIQMGDVKEWSSWGFCPGEIDLLIAGFPCQSFSIAGKRLGVNDPRGELALTLCEFFQHLKPKYFIFENVASMRKEHRAFLDDLFGVKSIKIDSALVSGQQRKRLYWTNIPAGQPQDKEVFLTRNGVPVHAWSKSARKNKSFDERMRVGKVNVLTTSINGTESVNFFPSKPIDFRPRKVWNRSELFYHQIKKEWMLTCEEAEELQTYPRGWTRGVSNRQRFKQLGNSFTVDVIAHILSYLDS